MLSRYRAATPAERAQIHMMEGVPFATGHLPIQADAHGHLEPAQTKYVIRGNELHMEEPTPEEDEARHPMYEVQQDGTVTHLPNNLLPRERNELAIRIQRDLERFVGEPSTELVRALIQEQIEISIATFLHQQNNNFRNGNELVMEED